MFELKSLSKETIPAALNKAERYRFLGEPVEAESICLDILDVEPDNEKALITLILALTDQFGQRQNPNAFKEALDSVSRLKDDYNKAYYTGIIYERRAKAHLNQPVPGAGHVAYGWFAKAMEFFEKAIAISPAGNEDAILRWNTCARIQIRNPSVSPQPETVETTIMDDDPSGPWRKR
ncbi:MAG TPA: hypothetical protein PKV75_08985 [Desulfobacterales bacterium]|nr:hypothetical protein [Desulfobacterales bacterium]